ncbi:MAG TPA: thioredoxin [Candidatus Doudnabacteria bacterium]|mgnify:CR=1 FL=1|nr:thioredoxin [Candidatus Doudnabacteria bacterium]
MSELKGTKDNFNSEVLQSDLPVLVDFWAEWCGPCKVIGPIISELATEYQGKLKVVKVNADEEPELTQQYSVMSIPTLKFFKGDKIVGEIVGAAPKATLVTEIEKHL